jgi:hypothetical protein
LIEKNNSEKFLTCPPLLFTLSTNLMYFFLIWKSADLNSLSVTNLRYGLNGEEETERRRGGRERRRVRRERRIGRGGEGEERERRRGRGREGRGGVRGVKKRRIRICTKERRKRRIDA